MSSKSDSGFKNFDKEKARGWYQKWRAVIYRWAKKHADSDFADILLFLPDLFILGVGLVLDPRVPGKLKIALVSAIAYVISPFDLIPEAVLGVAGLIDDASILIIVLHAVFGVLELDPDELDEILRDYWHGNESPVNIVAKLSKYLSENATRLFGKMWSAFQKLWRKQHGAANELASFGEVPIT